MSSVDNEEAFIGHQPRECGEHRTVGPHRAWCFECNEWCYPEEGCKGCRIPILEEKAGGPPVIPVNKCVYYIERERPTDIPEGQEYDGLRYTVCNKVAPYIVNGSSYCESHVHKALGRTSIKVGDKL